ncbi:ABC transporter ATP-binding protein [Olsenella sp. YH-ols2223]|uniref:ABC transporter ATP-binding protein n=1 Tax=Olsenella absiana TaxID=3115222 RepID=A0ABU7R9M0_9ACTN
MKRLLKRFLPPYRGRIALGVCFKLVEVVFDILNPLVVAYMIDRGVGGRDAGLVLRCGLLLVLFAAVGWSFTMVCQRMAAVVSQATGTDLRRALFEKVNELSAEDVDRFGTPSLVTRVTNDVNQIQVAVALGIRQLVRFPLIAVGAMVSALLIDWHLGVIFLACTPAIGLVFYLVMSRSVPYFRVMQRKLDKVSLVTREALSGVRVIRAFGREQAEKDRFSEAASDQAQTAIDVGRLSSVLNPATFLVMNLGIVCILWAGGIRVDAGELTQGQVMAFVNYMMQTLTSVAYIANLVVIFTRATASGQRIMEVLDCVPKVTDEGNRRLALSGGAPAISLAGVGFSYEGAKVPALTGVTLELGRGQTLGVIGGTGSGKSTLARLIARLYDPTEGTVRILGHDVAAYPFDQLREVVSIVPQQASLVSGTIRSNLSWRDEGATDEELWDALEAAQAADFVRAKPAGLDEVVEAGGRNFSGGQRQRLTIARALVGSPRICILDDSASALDFKTDARLRHALRERAGAMTSVVISQRVSSVMHADLICVLDHGRMVGLGTHEELLDGCPLYREIAESQLGAKEVA